MSISNSFFFSPLLFFILISFNSFVLSCCPQINNNYNPQIFNQKIHHFWEFDEQSNNWVQVKLPYDLFSCVNNNCTKVGSIDPMDIESETDANSKKNISSSSVFALLPLRKRVSLIKMSESSVWVTGESGSIYERFWNGIKWVIAPHDLPLSAGYALSIFIVNHTILAVSESGFLYQLQLSENSHPVWVEFRAPQDQTSRKETEEDSAIQLIKSGVTSHDRQRIYFCTKNGLLLELGGIEPPRWISHGRPPGANVAAIVDVASIRPQLLFTVSSTGDLYEYDRSSKPLWKKHIWREGSALDTSLTPSMGCSIHGISGPHSISLFLLTQGGNLVERRLHQRKWTWVVHGSPKDHHLTSITPVSQDEINDKLHSLFLTTAAGFIFEYQIPKFPGAGEENQVPKEKWVNHMHPPHAKAAKGIKGMQFQVGRMIFPLDDGRLGELHLSGLGGESSGPAQHLNINFRRKASLKYVWSILDAPETEGWNAEYCTEEYGSSNCILGIKDQANDVETTRSKPGRQRGTKAQQSYLLPGSSGSGSAKSVDEYYSVPDNWIDKSFRLRVMHEGRSFFLVTDSGLTFEYLNAENVWFWLRHEHEHSPAMKGALGNYNGSLFLVDENRNLLIRERSNNELAWINCTAIRKGRHVVAGSPWDGVPGRAPKVTPDDALFFVSKNGRLLQLTVSCEIKTSKYIRIEKNLFLGEHYRIYVTLS